MTWIDTKITKSHILTKWRNKTQKKLKICKIEDDYDNNEKLFLELPRRACNKKKCTNNSIRPICEYSCLIYLWICWTKVHLGSHITEDIANHRPGVRGTLIFVRSHFGSSKGLSNGTAAKKSLLLSRNHSFQALTM